MSLFKAAPHARLRSAGDLRKWLWQAFWLMVIGAALELVKLLALGSGQ